MLLVGLRLKLEKVLEYFCEHLSRIGNVGPKLQDARYNMDISENLVSKFVITNQTKKILFSGLRFKPIHDLLIADFNWNEDFSTAEEIHVTLDKNTQ